MAIGLLEVELKGRDFLGKLDPYVVVQYKTQERKSSVARGEGANPVWNETVRFKVEYPGLGNDYKLLLTIMDQDTFSADDCLGQATIYVKELLESGVENGTAQLKPQKYTVTQPDKSYNGEIQVGVSFTLKAEENTGGAECGGWKQSYDAY